MLNSADNQLLMPAASPVFFFFFFLHSGVDKVESRNF